MSTDHAESTSKTPPYSRFYDELVGEYDQMMDWESRLQREAPFFEKIIRDYQIRSLLDVGCGTGRHCFYFDTLGVETIVGVDPAVKTLEYARSRAAASGAEIEFLEASLTNLTERVDRRFDMVCVLGNSLSHLLKYDDLEAGLKNLQSRLDDDGLLVVQLMNWDRRLAKRLRFFPPRGYVGSQGEKIFFRFFDFGEELVDMNLVIFQANGPPSKRWTNRVLKTTLRPWRREIIRMAVDDAGLVIEHEYGGMDLSVFDKEESPDYIFIARKA